MKKALIKLAILDDYQQVALQSADWESLGTHCDITVFNHHLGKDDEVVKTLQDFVVICCMRERTPFPERVLQQLPNLKLLVTTGAKNAAIDLDTAKKLGIQVCGTQSPGHAASELAWALIMSLSKNIHIENRAIRQGLWQTSIGTDLKNQTLGVVGLGRHGKNIARFGQVFGMNVIAWSQNLTESHCEECGVTYVDKEKLFKTADVISIHLKMGQRNRGIIADQEFDWMKETALLVNTSRGPIINESSLLKALANHKIRGVGLDVYESEPLPDNHLLLLSERALLMPHMGYVTEQTYEVFYTQTVEAIVAWLAGKPIRILNER